MSYETALARHILQLVLDRLGHTNGMAVSVGGVYLVDHLGSHGYAALRRRTARGKDETVIHVRPRPRRGSVELQLPVTHKAAERLAEAVLGGRVRTIGSRTALDVTRSSQLELLAGEIIRLVELD